MKTEVLRVCLSCQKAKVVDLERSHGWFCKRCSRVDKYTKRGGR